MSQKIVSIDDEIYRFIELNVFIIDHDEMFYNIKICLNVTKKGIIHRILSMTKFLSSKLPKKPSNYFRCNILILIKKNI